MREAVTTASGVASVAGSGPAAASAAVAGGAGAVMAATLRDQPVVSHCAIGPIALCPDCSVWQISVV